MLVKLLTNTVLIAGVAVGGVLYLDYKGKSEDAAQMQAQTQDVQKLQTAAKPQSKAVKSASVVSIPKDPRSGQYHYKGRVNSGYVDFLVDTGASAIALTPADARKAGLRASDLSYDVPISTAGGRNYAARVTLDQVALGGIILRDVEALVVKEGLDISLLGMTWLGQLQEVKATPNALLLRY
ncbi:MAG: TIGR02281 family clan AA aspartic protease [Litorimonas sp.]